MWSTVAGLHLEHLNFMTKCTDWPSIHDSEFQRNTFKMLEDHQDAYWQDPESPPEDFVADAKAFPTELPERLSESHTMFEASTKERRTREAMVPPALLEELDKLYRQKFRQYTGLLGDRDNNEYSHLWNGYIREAREMVTKHCDDIVKEMRRSGQEPWNIVTAQAAEHKFHFYVTLQVAGLLPMLPVPTASVLRDLATQVLSVQWGVYAVRY